jgi:putative lipoic acid-binding regulatory protein
LTDGKTDEDSDEVRRRRALELLEANHVFPGPFFVSVIAQNDPAVERAVLAAAGLADDRDADAHDPKESSGGKYVSHRLRVDVASAEAVLDLFARLRAVDGVIKVL